MVFPDVLKVTVLRETDEHENFVLSVVRHREICHSFENLKNEIAARSPGLLQFDEIKFFWIDEEGDEITILNHPDYFDYMDSGSSAGQKRRIYAKGVTRSSEKKASVEFEEIPAENVSDPIPMEQSSPESLPENMPVHTDIICDVCDSTIIGHRYKCMQCFNYDLCMRCESRYRHKDHMMIRLPTPATDRRARFRLFDKLRSYMVDNAAQAHEAAAFAREDDFEGCRRSKRHHRRNSKDREESRERREEKERKERKHRRERSAKSAEERRSGRYGHGHNFNFSRLINQVIDPANISAFLSADAAAAAAAAAAESAQEAARATMANCPLFSASVTTTSTANGGTFTTSASTSASNSSSTSATTSSSTAEAPKPTEENNDKASAPQSTSEEPQAKKAAMSADQQQVNVLDLSWLAPTPESIQKINQTFSKILDPLGMNIEIRSNGAAAKPAQTQTPTEEKMDKTTETANTPTTSTPSQTLLSNVGSTVGANESTEKVSLVGNESTEVSERAAMTSTQQYLADLGLIVGVGHPKTAEKVPEVLTEAISSPECLLKDLEKAPGVNDVHKSVEKDPLTELEQKMRAAFLAQLEDDDSLSVSSVSLLSDNEGTTEQGDKVDKKWTLVDLPCDEEQASTSQPNTNSKAAKPATPPSVPEVASASSSARYPSIPVDYEQLGKALKQHLEAEKKAATASQASSKENTPSPSATAPLVLPIQTSIPMSAPPTTAQRTSPIASVPSITYSSRPHVNHAVHAMMAMGFSNEGGWLAQLLESVNGDIPRALDLLTPHKINP